METPAKHEVKWAWENNLVLIMNPWTICKLKRSYEDGHAGAILVWSKHSYFGG